MPKLPKDLDLSVCHFPKYKGQKWADVVHDPEGFQYMEWLLSLEGPKMTDSQYNFILEILENHDVAF